MELNKTGLDDRIFTAFAETSERRYIYLCNMDTHISRWSQNAVDYFGLPDEYMENAGVQWGNLVHPDDRDIYFNDINSIFTGNKTYHNLEYRVRNKEGHYVICTCKGMILPGQDGEPTLFAGSVTNHGVIEKVDPTTHLYNVYEFIHALKQLKQVEEPTLVMQIGINQFQNINDTYGYFFGNKVLKEFADKLMKLTHKLGIVYRMEGAKFALMFQSMTGEDATKLYQKIQTMARHSVFVDGEHIPLHISGGAIFVDSPYIGDRSIRTCLTYAQRKSRKELHSELVIFNNEQSNDNMKSLELFETIRQCVLHDCQGFYLCYQPLVRAEDGKVIGMEALLRWKREPYGNLAPGQFIQWLENDDCFFELGNWILRQAMTDGLEIIKDHPDFLVNVNVSYTQLDRSDFQTSLMQIIRETGFPPQNLYLELTERCRTADVDQLREVLDFFVSYGIKIALDDFGTGTASINLLRLLPISCLKIDRTFLTNIQTNKTDEIIVELVIDSANKLGMSVCLEGVENQQLRDYVQKYNVTNHQGYYYSKPIKIHAFREFLENNLLEA